MVTLIQVGRAQLGFARFWPRRAERALEVARQLARSPNPTSERFRIDYLATLTHRSPGWHLRDGNVEVRSSGATPLVPR